MAVIPTPVQTYYKYHDIHLEGTGRQYMHATRETVNLRYVTTWRGQDVQVTMKASKYTYSDCETWSDWRIYAEGALTVDTNGITGASVTDLARSKLSEVCEPLVLDWLASDAYRASLQRAYVNAAKGTMHDSGRRRPDGLRKVLGLYGDRMPSDARQQLYRVADAYDKYVKLLDAI